MWFIIIFFLGTVIGTVYNLLMKKKNGIDAIPFNDIYIKLFMKVE